MLNQTVKEKINFQNKIRLINYCPVTPLEYIIVFMTVSITRATLPGKRMLLPSHVPYCG